MLSVCMCGVNVQGGDPCTFLAVVAYIPSGGGSAVLISSGF